MGSLQKSEERIERPASMGSLERHASTANGRRIRLHVPETIPKRASRRWEHFPEADFGTTSSESALDVTSAQPVTRPESNCRQRICCTIINGALLRIRRRFY